MNYTIITSKLANKKRVSISDSSIFKDDNSLHITYCENDTLDKFEADINLLVGKNTSFLYTLNKRLIPLAISLISVFVILLAFLTIAIYEDFLKKIVLEMPTNFDLKDYISLFFVVFLFFCLLFMPKILDSSGNEFRNLISSWFNKEIRKIKRLKFAYSNFDKKIEIHLYNFDLEDEKHWLWSNFIEIILHKFINIYFYVRSDKVEILEKQLTNLGISNVKVLKYSITDNNFDVDILLSKKEQIFYSLLQLCSTNIIKNSDINRFISLEIFEYCGNNFNLYKDKDSLSFGFQSFISRSFDDFGFLSQEKSLQIYFTKNVKFKELNTQKKELSQYLRNHLEDCISNFENPISLLILYYYVKDLVLDEKRVIKILEKFINSIKEKQQYELINDYWFDIAGFMFDSHDINSFEESTKSYYRKISILALNDLAFLFERNGYFEQSILINQYLYEINPNKYILNICSLYERMGNFDLAYKYLPKEFNIGKNIKPSDIEIKYYQRKSWIIIFQRENRLKTEGIKALENLENLLFSHNEDNNPLWLWHFYNIKANLCEWEEDYDEAIKFYLKCLSIPALGAFEYGATFVNMAISYRLKYLIEINKDNEIINKAIKLGKLGVILKESVGDRDEMPIVLHNFALNILYKILISYDEKQCFEVLEVTNEALEILEETKSIKRLGMVLIENYIARSLLKLDYEDTILKLERNIVDFSKSEYKQIKEIYNEFRKDAKIDKIKFLE
ncbi:tetratricopeptide repeat protein [Aliarcobacter lanthieri]|uniref:tetratricopeptide repeat protein n=1 Tax=Aliarcobacter lanthieri TaxID=1355374 RepID=UPI003AAD1A5B